MCRTHRIILLAGLAVVMCAMSSPLVLSEPQKTEQLRVSVDDIGKRLLLIGPLGEPLGTLMTIKGTWNYPDSLVKDGSLRFRVTHVNAKKLESEVELNIAQVKATDRNGNLAIPKNERSRSLVGVSWTVRGYESGRFNGKPEGFWKETDSGPAASPYWFDIFTSELICVVQK